MCYYNAQNSTCAFVYTRTVCGVQCNSILLEDENVLNYKMGNDYRTKRIYTCNICIYEEKKEDFIG